MDPNDPRHGTYAGSQAHRRAGQETCPPCREARRRYQKRLEVDHERGTRRLTDVTQLREHLHALHETGMPYKEIARLAGLHHRTVFAVAGVGSQKRATVTPRVTAALLAVKPQTPTKGYLPRIGMVRRIRALIAIGYTNVYLADRAGMGRQNLSALIHNRRVKRRNDWCQVATWKKVAALYDELAMTPGPSQISRDRARRYGWAPPLAWDNIDDPNETPEGYGPPAIRYHDSIDENVIQRVLAGDILRTTRAEKEEIMRRWLASGGSARSLENRMGWQQGRYKAPAREAS